VDDRLNGRVALVTGANHGIGAATAIALAGRGADVAITYLRGAGGDTEYERARAQGGGAVGAEIEAVGRRCFAVEADLVDAGAPCRLYDQVEDELGPVSVLVHNASGWRKDSFADGGIDDIGRPNHRVTAATADPQLIVDARAGALLMAEHVDRHRARGDDWGRIVTLTSGVGLAVPGEVSYGAAKAALISYTLSAAAEMAGDGITANVVYPPVTDTGWITDEVRAFVASDHDHHHIADPAEVAEVIAWLCAEAGRIVTGNVIRLR
jgi:3-oxoacyl-[acyl-carrier protein] reductase